MPSQLFDPEKAKAMMAKDAAEPAAPKADLPIIEPDPKVAEKRRALFKKVEQGGGLSIVGLEQTFKN